MQLFFLLLSLKNTMALIFTFSQMSLLIFNTFSPAVLLPTMFTETRAKSWRLYTSPAENETNKITC